MLRKFAFVTKCGYIFSDLSPFEISPPNESIIMDFISYYPEILNKFPVQLGNFQCLVVLFTYGRRKKVEPKEKAKIV